MTTKPTRDECIRQAAPHLAALVLKGRATDRAQSTDAEADASPTASPVASPSDRPTAA